MAGRKLKGDFTVGDECRAMLRVPFYEKMLVHVLEVMLALMRFRKRGSKG